MSRHLCLAVVACAALCCQAQPPRTPARLEAEYYVAVYARHYGVPIALVQAIVQQESGWQACAVSRKGAVGLMQLANGFVNVNTFSLHGMYRMRLTRAYLGASNFARHPDNFTNFDPHDNPYEANLVRHDAPLHIINTTLNLVATTNLAWQQRKGESFTFSPISVGCWRLGYLPTSFYGGSKGVTLGTAMSISGAAFNPNMGYNSSPLVTLLMTFFNARLGWWLPNPAWPVLKSKRLNSANLASADLPSATELECLLRKQGWATG